MVKDANMDNEERAEMEEGVPKSTEKEQSWFIEELKKVSFLAGPMVVISISQYLLLAVSMMMTGHLGSLPLSGVSVATSFTNAIGFSIVLGLSGALETLCGQAYGAGQYKKFGSYFYCAIICLIPVCVPISIVWIFMDKILIPVGIDPQISRVAGKYSITLIPAIFAFAVLQCLFRYFQTQSLILPVLISSCATLSFHIPICWALIYKWEFGDIGGAISIGLSCWLNAVFLASYMRCSYSCEKTRILCWKDTFSSIGEFWRYALPSGVMGCLEWWTFELLTLLAGLLPNSKLETSVLSICMITTGLHYSLQCGFGAAASVRVSNELGAGNAQAARSVVFVVLLVSAIEAAILSTVLFFCRHILGYAYTNDQEVVKYVTNITPLLCLSLIMDSLQTVLSGIARGCGWQRIGVCINLAAYYFVGLPVSIVLCFVLHLRGKGLWIGALVGSTVQVALLALVTSSTNWQKQATMAKERIFKGQLLQTVDGSIEL